MSRFRLFMAVFAIGAVSVQAAVAETFALVVGINDYAYEKKLKGAVADADDMEQALRKFGVRSVTTLRDREATFERVSGAWTDMVRKAKSGDVIFWSYAGHGGQEPTSRKDLEGASGKDETLLLAGFHPKSAPRERIVDKEINAWLKEAGDKGLRVVFVADSCHSGGLTRGVKADARGDVTYRSGNPYERIALPPSPASVAGAAISMETLPHVTFLAAVEKNKLAPEVVINGQKRGALSWAFARALEGDVARTTKGALTRGALEGYMRVKVRQASDFQQIPEFAPRSAKSEIEVMSVGETGSPPTPATTVSGDITVGAGGGAAPTAIAAGSKIRLRILNADGGREARIAGGLRNVELAAEGQTADFAWDAKAGQLISALGDVVAHEVAEPFLNGALEKWRTVAVLKDMAVKRNLDVNLVDGDRLYRQGEEVKFASGSIALPYVTVLNLAPDGEIQFLYPSKTDPKQWTPGQPYAVSARVTPKYGAEHLVVIATSKPLSVFQDQVRTINIKDLPGYLVQSVQGMDVQLGLVPLFTSP